MLGTGVETKKSAADQIGAPRGTGSLQHIEVQLYWIVISTVYH